MQKKRKAKARNSKLQRKLKERKLVIIDRVIENNPTLANKPRYIANLAKKRSGLDITEKDVEEFFGFPTQFDLDSEDAQRIYNSIE